MFSPIGSMAMHSTGQGGRHSSQPVHSGATMVCICLAAPTMASTGQAWMHSVQPMQVCSSMMATDFGFSSVFGIQRLDFAAEQIGQLADAFLAAGRAQVDVGLALGDRFGVGLAAGVAALAALRLRQDGLDLVRPAGRPRP